jgi:hypothetical protein
VAADLGDRLHQPGVRRHVRHRHQPRSQRPHQLDHRRHVDAARRQVRRVHDFHPEPPPERQERDLVGDEVVAGGQDDVVRPEVDRRERGRIGVRSTTRERDVVRTRAEQCGGLGVEAANRVGPQRGRLVPADRRLECDMVLHGSQNGSGEQAAACVVEVDHVRDTGGLGAQSVQ